MNQEFCASQKSEPMKKQQQTTTTITKTNRYSLNSLNVNSEYVS